MSRRVANLLAGELRGFRYDTGMKQVFCFAVVLALLPLAGTAHAATNTSKFAATDQQGMEAVKTITKITGVALSPLLGVGAVGAYDWFTCPKDQGHKLPWYAQWYFWLPSLLLAGSVAVKDAFGTVLPPGLKKPLDVAETIENKVSGLVAVGAFVPMVASVFKSAEPAAAAMGGPGAMLGSMLGVDLMPLLNVFSIPLGIAAFAVVWLLGHVINVLILISPFGAVDAALKAVRASLMGLLVIVNSMNPWAAAGLSLVIIVVAYFLAGWSFRMMVFGWIYTWDFVTRRRKRFQPDPKANWMFTGRKIERTPVRTYGQLHRDENGKLVFEYRPWFVMAKRTVLLPEGNHAIGRGLFYPNILLVEGEKTKNLMSLPPRYKKHEEALGQIYSISDIRDTGILKGLKAFWRWWTTSVFGKDSSEAAAAVAQTNT
jgi:hypothetical protein